MFNSTSKEHVDFIMISYHIDHLKPGHIWSILTDPDCFEKYGVQPIPALSKNYLYRKLQPDGRWGKNSTLTQAFLVEWRSALLDERLTHTRACIQELTKIVDDSTSSDRDKISAIQAIRAMVGSDDAVMKALEGSGGKTIVNLNVQDEILKHLFSDDVDEKVL